MRKFPTAEIPRSPRTLGHCAGDKRQHELENDRVRVLHVTVEPNTKIELHELDDAVVVSLSDYESTLKTANGQTTKVKRTPGKPAWVPAGGREFEAGSKGVDALLIEIKRAAAPK